MRRGQLVDADVEHLRDPQRVPADGADHRGGRAEGGERVVRPGDDERARALAEQHGLAAVHGHLGAVPAGDARLRQRDGEPALGDVVRGAQRARAHGLADRGVDGPQLAQVGGRQLALRRLAAQLRQLRAGRRRGPAARGDQRHGVAGLREAEPARALRVGQLADHAHHGRRVDRAAAALVVERDVPAHDRHAERAARVGQPGHRAGQLPGDVRLLGVAEVEAVRQAEGLGPHAGEVGRALQHRLHRPAVGVDGDAPAVAVDRHGERPGRLCPPTKSAGYRA